MSKKKPAGSSVGKDPAKNVRTNLTSSKYETGGAKVRKKGGGYIRKPKPPVKYSHRKKKDK